MNERKAEFKKESVESNSTYLNQEALQQLDKDCEEQHKISTSGFLNDANHGYRFVTSEPNTALLVVFSSSHIHFGFIINNEFYYIDQLKDTFNLQNTSRMVFDKTTNCLYFLSINHFIRFIIDRERVKGQVAKTSRILDGEIFSLGNGELLFTCSDLMISYFTQILNWPLDAELPRPINLPVLANSKLRKIRLCTDPNYAVVEVSDAKNPNLHTIYELNVPTRKLVQLYTVDTNPFRFWVGLDWQISNTGQLIIKTEKDWSAHCELPHVTQSLFLKETRNCLTALGMFPPVLVNLMASYVPANENEQAVQNKMS